MLRTAMKKIITCALFIMVLAGLTACGDPQDVIEGAMDARAEITGKLVDQFGTEALGLKPYLMQSLTYDDGTYGASGTCETVYVHINKVTHKMNIYEFGLYDSPDISLPWSSKETASKISPREDGILSGVINNRAMGITGYFRFDPVTMLEPGEWQDNADGFQWYDIRYSESNRDGHMSEQFDPENADSQTIWRVDTTGETTLWDWAVFMEGNSIISGMFLAEAEAVAEKNGYSTEGFKPGKEMMEGYEAVTGYIPPDETEDMDPDGNRKDDDRGQNSGEGKDKGTDTRTGAQKYVEFGEYPEGKPIEWIVLDEKDGARLLLSRYSLDFMSYNNENVEVTWETSDLRNWMNGYFYEEAFSKEEKKRIQTVTMENDDADGGNDTEDKVFALSLSEVEQYFGVRDLETGEILKNPENGDILIDREALKTVCIEETRPQYFYEGDVVPSAVEDPDFFFLRTQGYHPSAVYFVFPDGDIGGAESAHWEHGVRPAVWVK